MARELRRVPMGFDYPLHKVWYGFLCKPSFCHTNKERNYCEPCKAFAKIKGVPISDDGCPNYDEHFFVQPSIEPPIGEGYQLWETTSEGSPSSPVFATLDELCEWCEANATTFADFKASKEKWRSMLEARFVHHQDGNVIFI